MDSAIDWIAGEPAFRGLWESKLMLEDGRTEEGWCVTFIHGGNYLEMEYQATPEGAIELAKKLLLKLREEED